MRDFDPDCRLCPRLADHLDKIHHQYPDYHAKPVAPFGSNNPKLFIVGLAPGLHGANATGRPFTGDHAGIILYDTLYRYGFANQARAISQNDGLKLIDCRISNAVKCLPPENKPTAQEITQCNAYLGHELNLLSSQSVVLALGRVAHNAVLKAFTLKQSEFAFKHGALHLLPVRIYLLDSYHCSRYNTQTGRLNAKMFDKIFDKIHEIININA